MVADNKLSQYFFSLNLSKLFSKGKINILYEKMYNTAHKLAAEELRKNLDLINIELKDNLKRAGKNYFEEYFKKMMRFKGERIEHHMKEMKELLKLSLEEKK